MNKNRVKFRDLHKTESHKKSITLSREGSAILTTLVYFNIFKYPLTINEIYRKMPCDTMDIAALNHNLNELLAIRLIEKHGHYYAPAGSDLQNNVIKRLNGNRIAKKMRRRAYHIGRFIGSFPFVRAVFISGTLSKNYMDRDSDVDFFIITSPGHLWTAKMFLTLFKKICLLNSYKYFCLNYFIDSNHLRIPDQNRFTATELMHLYPVYNKSLCRQFMSANKWALDFYPNFPIRKTLHHKRDPGGFVKKYLEKVIKKTTGKLIEQWSYRLFTRHIKRKYSHIDDQVSKLAYRSKPHTSKYHPNNYQDKVQIAFNQQMAEIQINPEVNLSCSPLPANIRTHYAKNQMK